MDPLPYTEEEWKTRLSPEEYRVLRMKGTEAPWEGVYVDTHEDGVYRCRACATPLFSSDTKFNSNSGWPSFTNPAVAENVGTRIDHSNGMERTEVFCKHCGSHLGHVFDDGPAEAGGKRYCINSLALDFAKDEN